MRRAALPVLFYLIAASAGAAEDDAPTIANATYEQLVSRHVALPDPAGPATTPRRDRGWTFVFRGDAWGWVRDEVLERYGVQVARTPEYWSDKPDAEARWESTVACALIDMQMLDSITSESP